VIYDISLGQPVILENTHLKTVFGKVTLKSNALQYCVTPFKTKLLYSLLLKKSKSYITFALLLTWARLVFLVFLIAKMIYPWANDLYFLN